MTREAPENSNRGHPTMTQTGVASMTMPMTDEVREAIDGFRHALQFEGMIEQVEARTVLEMAIRRAIIAHAEVSR